jgi:hypothetical protein
VVCLLCCFALFVCFFVGRVIVSPGKWQPSWHHISSYLTIYMPGSSSFCCRRSSFSYPHSLSLALRRSGLALGGGGGEGFASPMTESFFRESSFSLSLRMGIGFVACRWSDRSFLLEWLCWVLRRMVVVAALRFCFVYSESIKRRRCRP